MRTRGRGRPAVSSIVGSIFFVLIMIVSIASLVTIFNSFTGYNQQVIKAGNSNRQAADTQLSVTSGQFGAFPPSTTSNFNVATNCGTTSTQTTNTGHLFYGANMWWDFFTGAASCGTANYDYSTSFDGVTWQAPTSIPGVITSGYTLGPYWNIDVLGTTIYLVIAKVGAADFQLGIGTLSMGGTNSAPAGTISWLSAPAQVATTASVDTVAGPIQIEVDSSGNVWVATVQGATAIGVYERQSCASGTSAANGWENAAPSCASATAPLNYAPTGAGGNPNFGVLSANANMIMMAAPSTLSSTGVIVIYETGSATVPSTGTMGLITQATLASTTWNVISVASLTLDYSLTSSSTAWISSTIYFAGQAGTAVGDNTCSGAQVCTLRFWTAAFTSMTAATLSSDATGTNGNPIQSTSQLWEAALTVSGTTLALFDSYPTSTTISYFTSGTLGSLWSSAITLESAETAVNGLAPSAPGVLAVTWASASGANSCGTGVTGPCVRFAALSTFTLSNVSPFSVHVVDLYVYNPATNAIVAHWYFNTTGTGAEDFDWWVGQGGTTSIPLRFVWAANTAYLITFSTDAGVTAQTTLTTLPGGTVSCPSGQFFYQIAPNDLCATSGASTNPFMTHGAGTNTCTDSSASAEYMGLGMAYTTSATTSGNLFVSFAFQITSPATTTISSAWQLVYGSGTAPTCELTTSFGGTATLLGEPYTVRIQSANIKAMDQSVAVSLSGLAPSTTYWFDIQATNSGANAWIYSNPNMAVTDVLSTNSPTLATSASTTSCSISSATAGMGGLGATFTTGGTGFSGTVFADLAFNIAQTTAGATTAQYKVAWGTGAAPTCHQNPQVGTTTGQQTYTFVSQSTTIVGGAGQKVGFVMTGLTASTTYWVDVQETDSSAATWVYSNPVLAVMNVPNAGANSLPSASQVTSAAAACNDASANFAVMAGFNLKYNIPSTATGDLFLTLTFEVTIPATVSLTSTWQMAYQSGVAPACNVLATGTTIGQSFVVESGPAVAGGQSQTETEVIPNIQRLAGNTIWIDVQAFDSSGATWTYSLAAVSVVDFPA